MTSLPSTQRLLADTAWLRRLAQQLTGDVELAADLQQEVTVAALSQPRSAVAGRSWLAAVARNLAVSLRRRRAVEARCLQRLPPREPAPSPAELVATAELQQRAVAAVLALPAVYRDTVLRRFLQGLSQQATAEAMGVPEETVRTRQKRALAMLRAQLAPTRRERRGLAALLSSLAAMGAIVKAKHVLAAVAFVLIALLVTVPLLPPAPRAPAVQDSHEVAVAQADLGARDPELGADRQQVDPQAKMERTAAVVASPALAPSTAELTVAVHWPQGAPADGCAIVCNRYRGNQSTLRSGVTDAAGQLVFSALPPGRYFLNTMQYDSEVVDLVAGAHEQVSFTLAQGFAVHGVVLDRGGAPVAGAAVWIAHVGVGPNWTFPAGNCDRIGRFVIPGCRSGMMVGASAPSFGVSDGVMLDTERHGGATPQEVVLRLEDRVTEVHGRVIDADGRPVAAAWVELGDSSERLRPDDEGRLWQAPPRALRTTDAQGRFDVAQVRVDGVDLLVTHPGFAPHRQDLALDAHLSREVTVVLQPGGTLTGSVRDDRGEPLAGVEVEGPHEQGLECSVTTGADGAFTLRDLPREQVTVTVTAKDWPRQQRTFPFAGGEPQSWDVVLAKGLRIHGRLVDNGGAPLVGWWISLAGGNRRAKSNGEGRFVVIGCEAAGNQLIVRNDFGFAPEVLRFTDVVSSEAERDFLVPASAMPSARLRGRCVGPDGAPLAEVTIDCVQQGSPVLLHHEVLRVGADGSVDLGPFPPGPYAFMPRHLRLVFAPVLLDLQPDEVHDLGVLRGFEPARLLVRIVGDAAAAQEMHVALVSGAGRSDSVMSGSERTFAQLLPGTYRLVVRGGDEQDHDRDAGEVELAEGAVVTREVSVR